MSYISIVQLFTNFLPTGWYSAGGGGDEGGCCTSGKCQLQAPGSLTPPDLHPVSSCLLCSPPSPQQLFNIDIFNWQQTLQIEDKKSHTARPAPRLLCLLYSAAVFSYASSSTLYPCQ